MTRYNEYENDPDIYYKPLDRKTARSVYADIYKEGCNTRFWRIWAEINESMWG